MNEYSAVWSHAQNVNRTRRVEKTNVIKYVSSSKYYYYYYYSRSNQYLGGFRQISYIVICLFFWLDQPNVCAKVYYYYTTYIVRLVR